MSWHPRMPPFIHLSQTKTRHHGCHQSPCQPKWCHFSLILIGCSHTPPSVPLTTMVSLSFLFSYWTFPHSAVLLCHENSHSSFPFVLIFPQPTFTPIMISCHSHMSQATLVVYKNFRWHLYSLVLLLQDFLCLKTLFGQAQRLTARYRTPDLFSSTLLSPPFYPRCSISFLGPSTQRSLPISIGTPPRFEDLYPLLRFIVVSVLQGQATQELVSDS